MKKETTKIKAAIFDMDGTIIDTENIWQKVMSDFLAKRGITELTPLQKKALDDSAGGGLPKAAEIFKREFNFKESIEVLIQEKVDLSLEYMQKYQVNFIKGFPDFHEFLKKNSILTGVGTNAGIPTLNILAQKLNFQSFFGKDIYSMDHVEKKAKPNPALFLHVAKQLNVNPKECLVFEDSIAGFQAAKKAGMTLVAIKNEKNSKILDQADFVINDYSQADEIIKKFQ